MLKRLMFIGTALHARLLWLGRRVGCLGVGHGECPLKDRCWWTERGASDA